MKRKVGVAVGLLVLAAAGLLAWVLRPAGKEGPLASVKPASGSIAEVAPDVAERLGDAEAASEEALSAEEAEAAAVEAKVDAFDNLTDAWREPSARPITMEDVDAFARTFREVPSNRRDECAHRALNLVPDENVMLLAGILMDKKEDREIVEMVFNDILNRDEDVKKPILEQIFRDRDHVCWADAAWILDATGALEKKAAKVSSENGQR